LTARGCGAIKIRVNAAQDSPIGFRFDESGVCPCSGWQRFASQISHPRIPGSVILSGGDGDDARHYQEKQVLNAIREAAK
jgi:hypothetical protein